MSEETNPQEEKMYKSCPFKCPVCDDAQPHAHSSAWLCLEVTRLTALLAEKDKEAVRKFNEGYDTAERQFANSNISLRAELEAAKQNAVTVGAMEVDRNVCLKRAEAAEKESAQWAEDLHKAAIERDNLIEQQAEHGDTIAALSSKLKESEKERTEAAQRCKKLAEECGEVRTLIDGLQARLKESEAAKKEQLQLWNIKIGMARGLYEKEKAAKDAAETQLAAMRAKAEAVIDIYGHHESAVINDLKAILSTPAEEPKKPELLKPTNPDGISIAEESPAEKEKP